MRFCPYNLSLTLQSLGYDGEYNYCWIETQHDGFQLMTLSDCEKYRHDISPRCAAPRLDDAAYFLRDRREIWIELKPTGTNLFRVWIFFGYRKQMFDKMIVLEPSFDNYDTALESAVTKAIEIIKSQK